MHFANLQIQNSPRKSPPEIFPAGLPPLRLGATSPPPPDDLRYTPEGLTARLRKMMVGRLLSFWDGLSSGAMLKLPGSSQRERRKLEQPGSSSPAVATLTFHQLETPKTCQKNRLVASNQWYLRIPRGFFPREDLKQKSGWKTPNSPKTHLKKRPPDKGEADKRTR